MHRYDFCFNPLFDQTGIWKKCKNNKLKHLKQFNNLFNNDFCGLTRIIWSRSFEIVHVATSWTKYTREMPLRNAFLCTDRMVLNKSSFGRKITWKSKRWEFWRKWSNSGKYKINQKWFKMFRLSCTLFKHRKLAKN